jgi:hypothetical protein
LSEAQIELPIENGKSITGLEKGEVKNIPLEDSTKCSWDPFNRDPRPEFQASTFKDLIEKAGPWLS